MPPIPENDHWPNCGEIDILEHIGRLKKHLLFSLHSKNHNHTRKDGIQYTTNVTFDVDFSDDFHVYAMEWTKDYIEYFVDGKSYCRYNKLMTQTKAMIHGRLTSLLSHIKYCCRRWAWRTCR